MKGTLRFQSVRTRYTQQAHFGSVIHIVNCLNVDSKIYSVIGMVDRRAVFNGELKFKTFCQRTVGRHFSYQDSNHLKREMAPLIEIKQIQSDTLQHTFSLYWGGILFCIYKH